MTIKSSQLYIALGSLVAALLVFWAGYTKGLKDAPCGPSLTGSAAIAQNIRASSVALKKRADLINQIQEESDDQSAALASAIADNYNWGSEPLPADVADKLRKP